MGWLLTAFPAAAQEPRLPAPLYPDATLESLNGPDPPIEALILRARLLSTAGRFRESAQGWQAVADREPVLASFGREEAVRALLDAGDLQPALEGLARLTTAPAADTLLRAAAAARAAGMLERAVALYKQARNGAGHTSAADQAALGMAATLEQAGTPREALDVLRELQLTFRQPSAYDEADAAARRLSAQLNDPEPLTEPDYAAIVDRLSGVAAFRRAVDVLAEWHRRFPDSTHGDRIEIVVIQSLYSVRANDEARSHAESFLKRRSPGPETASVFRTLFNLDVREGRTQEVERRGRAILDGGVKGATLDQRQGVAQLLAEYLVSVGQASRALGVYDELYRITKSRGDRIDVLWRLAIASLRAGSPAKAKSRLRQVRRLKLDSETDRATTYWLAYALDASGSREEARTLWTGLINRYPFSYYGVRAAAQFGIPAPAPAPALAFPQLTLGDSVTAHADYRLASLLSKAGLLPEAALYARRLATTFRRDDAAALLAARASAAAGEPSAASTLMSAYFGAYLDRPATGVPDDLWTLAYPRAYFSDISASATRHRVDPLLMVALARQESHFDRTARSPVGAIGLFQIMPATAAELDPAFAVDRAEDELVRSDVAAELAATLLEQNLARFQGALAPAIASYNADKGRVQVWWNAARGGPEELFVDSIPYRETRRYVRQVLANYAMYQRYGAPPASP